MKGLLLKDALILFRQSRLLAALMLALALFSGTEPLVLRSISVLYAALLPINVLAYDERSGWDRVVAVLPYSRAAVVGEKYLLAAVGVLGTTLLSLLSEWVVGGFALPMESIAAALMYACIVLLLTAISLPPMFRYGLEKGRLFYFVFVGTFVEMIFVFGEWLSALLAGDAALPVLLLAAVVVLPISAAFSAAGYGKRCFS